MIPLRVGVCIIECTRKKLMLPKLLEDYCMDGSMKFIVIDMNRSLNEQGPFDVIIHKILEWYNLGEDVGDAMLLKLLDYVQSCKPPPKMLDPIEETVNLADRFYSMQVMKDCEFSMKGIKVFVPRFCFLEKTESEKVLDVLGRNTVGFPLITKPPITRCDAEAHDMSIIFSESNIEDIMAPCVIQEFVNHGSKLYKVAAVGEQMYICERPSVKNLHSSNHGTVYFDSLTVSKRDIHNAKLHDQNPKLMEFRTTAGDECEMLLDEDIVTAILRKINARIDLSLFGIDIIVEESTGNYGLIDLNYLPSYDGVLDHFAKDLVDKLHKYNTKRLIAN